MATRVRYGEGDAFAIPLEGAAGYATGLVARVGKKGVTLGYFFGPCLDAVPALADLANLAASDSVLVAKFGDLGLIRGAWPVLGHLPRWHHEDWPMPAFGREEYGGRLFRVEYADDDPSSKPREVSISRGEFELLPQDGLAGFGFIEARLTRLLTT